MKQNVIWVATKDNYKELRLSQEDIENIDGVEIYPNEGIGGGGPEIIQMIGVAADVVTIAGGVVAAIAYLKPKILEVINKLRIKHKAYRAEQPQTEYGDSVADCVILEVQVNNARAECIIDFSDTVTSTDMEVEKACQVVVKFIDENGRD